MNNLTEYYLDISQLYLFDNNNSSLNKSIYNLTADDLSYFIDVNCCTTTSTTLSSSSSPSSSSSSLSTTSSIINNTNHTHIIEPSFTDKLESLTNDRVGILSFLFFFSFTTVFGNSLVILAVKRERYLHTATNYFITSLAVADCLVGLVVMPFSALYDVLSIWFFGTDWCDVWHSLDVLFSTASILNLCVISLDRYWAITDPFSYPMRMTRKRSAALIAAVWVCSSAISFPAIMWWRAARTGEMEPYTCPFTKHLGYLVFSSTISFYLPLLVMVFTYCQIYRAAVIQTRSLKIGTKQVLMASGELQLTLRIHRGGTTREPHYHHHSHHSHHHHQHSHSHHNNNNQSKQQQQLPVEQLQLGNKPKQNLNEEDNQQKTGLNQQQQQQQSPQQTQELDEKQKQQQYQQRKHHSASATASSTPEEPEEEPLSALQNNGLGRHRHMGKNFSLSRKLAKFAKEKKAAKTLGIVMGVFIICWLPFFIINLLSGFCENCIAHEDTVLAVVTWLGWINSSMNPVIYACWSRDFRRAFVRILCVCCPRKIRRKYQPTMRSKASQCHVAAMVAAASASVTYSSVNQCDSNNRSIM